MSPRAIAIRGGWASALAALVSLAPFVKGGDRQPQKNKAPRVRRRWSKVAGLLAAGAAVGAVGAAVRRRRSRQWDEYDPEHAFDIVHSTTASSAGTTGIASASVDKTMDMAATGVDKAAAVASSALDKGGEKLSAALGAAQDRAGSGAQTAQPASDRAGEKAGDVVTKTGSPSRNGHS